MQIFRFSFFWQQYVEIAETVYGRILVMNMADLYLHLHNLVYLSQVLFTQKLASTEVVGTVQVIIIFVSVRNYVHGIIIIVYYINIYNKLTLGPSTTQEATTSPISISSTPKTVGRYTIVNVLLIFCIF